MPQYPRKFQKVFGSALSAPGNVAVVGSLAAGAPAYSNDLDTIQSLAQYLSGFQGIVIGNKSPTIQDMTALMLMQTQQIAYLLQSGLPEWIATETYYAGNQCRVGIAVFTSLTNNNTGNNPLTDSNNWASGAGKYQVSASMGASQIVPVDTLEHKLNFNVEAFDPYGVYNAATYEYVAPVRGEYRVSAFVQIDDSTSDENEVEFALRITNGGGAPRLANGMSVRDPAGLRWYPSVMGTITLAAGEAIHVGLAANDTINTGNVTVANANFSVERL